MNALAHMILDTQTSVKEHAKKIATLDKKSMLASSPHAKPTPN